MKSAAGVLDVGEIPRRRQIAELDVCCPGRELRDDGRNDRPRRLARPVGVERPRDDDRQRERVEEAERDRVGANLRRAVRRLRTQRVLLVDRHILRRPVHFARRRVDEPLDPRRARGLAQVQACR